ncbi:MAG: SMP-30/gluconolactonase/LRE family protein [Pseudomonadota bacterium]
MRLWPKTLLAGLVALPLAALAEPVVINPKSAFPEGPVVVGDLLYYTQYGDGKVMTWDGKANQVFWEQADCGPSAIVTYGEGFLVTCYDAGSLVLVSKAGETTKTITEDATGDSLLGPNDATADGAGGLYVTASGPWESAPIVGKIYHLDSGGTLTAVADDLHYPNGIARSGDLLYVVESEAGRVVTFAIAADASLSDRRSFVVVRQVDPVSGVDVYPDGLKLGPDGNLYIAQYSLGRIVVVDKQGSFVSAIDVPSPAAPNLAFSADGKTVYVMAVDDVNNAPYWGKVYSLAR